MAKVLLINPPLTREELYKRGSAATASINPPLGLAYIAAVLEQQGHKVEIIDGIASDISVDETVDKAKDFDFIGMTVLSSFLKRCIELIGRIKSATSAPIIAGGAHATAMPLSLLEVGADYIVIGEGEMTMSELIGALLDKPSSVEKVKGIAFFKDGRMIKTERRPLIKNLDDLPMPARHLLPMEKYKTSEARAYRHPSHAMIASRGCRGNCTFCFKGVFGTELRYHSPERIVQEMFILRDQYKAKDIAFADDNFTTNRDVVMEVCRLLVDRKLNLPWSCEARIDSVDEEMLRAMKHAGCEFVAYGIESGSDRILRSINKKLTTAMITAVVRKTQAVGIAIRGYFIIGFIGETEKEMYQTIRFATFLNIDIATFSFLVPFPGTVDYVRAQREGGKFDPNFFSKNILPEFNFLKELVYCPQGVSPERLLQIHKEAYRRFYYRVSFVFNELSSIRNWQDIRRLARGVKTLLGN